MIIIIIIIIIVILVYNVEFLLFYLPSNGDE